MREFRPLGFFSVSLSTTGKPAAIQTLPPGGRRKIVSSRNRHLLRNKPIERGSTTATVGSLLLRVARAMVSASGRKGP